ncbi:MAG: NAD-dependent epimerase/dehydratase family protein [Candidatus Polarisedimenticolia bacterium]
MIAVTGFGGHLGQWVVARLTARGHDVIGISRSPLDRPTIAGLTWARPVRPVSCDLSDPGSVATLADVLTPATALIHLAAFIPEDTGRGLPADAEATLAANVRGTVHLLAALNAVRPESLVYASTFEVYGAPRSLPIRESHPTEPLSYYGASKLAGESYVDLFGRTTGTPSCSVRLPAVYGPGSRIRRALENFIAAAAAGRPMVIQGDGADLRELVFVEDAAEAIVSALERRARGPLNLGTGRGHSILEMAQAVKAAAGGHATLTHADRVKPRLDYALDIARARADLQWAPRTSLQDGIRAHLRWARGLPIS